MIIVGLLLAVVIGLLLGLLGGGGSILAVPVFAYVLGLDAKVAIAASFGVIAATSLIGARLNARKGNIDVRSALMFAAGSSVVAFGAGAWLSRLLDGIVQMVIFATVMLAAATFMLRGRGQSSVEPARSPLKRLLLMLSMGSGVGVITGIAGAGGGFMIVPALVLIAGTPMKRAVGTSLLVIAINSVAALAGYLLQEEVRAGIVGATIDGVPMLPYLVAFTLFTAAGTIAGNALSRRVPPAVLRRSFALFLVVMALYLVVRNALLLS
jgi:hypothetical protein